MNARQVPDAVVGGIAVGAWVSTIDPDAARATRDVDILARREDLEVLSGALLPIGLIRDEVRGGTLFIERDDPSPKRGVHVVIANETNPAKLHPPRSRRD